MKQKRAHYGNALEYQKLQDRNPVEATEIQPYINKYGLLTSSMRHPNKDLLPDRSKSGLTARCFSVKKSVLVK